VTAPLRHLVRYRAAEWCAGVAARARSSPVPSTAALAASVARVALSQAVYVRPAGPVVAYPARIRVVLTPAGHDRVGGVAALLGAEIADRAWELVLGRAGAPCGGGRFGVHLDVDPDLEYGYRVLASTDLAAPAPPPPPPPPSPPSPPPSPPSPPSPPCATAAGSVEPAGRPTPVLRLRGRHGAPVAVTAVEDPLAVGRSRGNDLVLDDPRVSGRHLTISWQDGAAVAEDLGSTNGTWHNGHRLGRAVLGDGDRLRVGRTLLVVELPGDPTAGSATRPAEDPPTEP
jgi:hypothetical protein